MSFLNELKRRNVLRVGAAYIVTAWLLIQVAETIFPLFGFSDTPARLVVIILAIGLIPSLIVSWVFEITPEGLKRDADVDREQSITHITGRKLDRIILVVLALALAYFAFDRFILVPARVAEIVEETVQQTRSEALVESYGDKSIAVLPFVNMSSDPEQEYFSDGVSEELLNLLSKIPGLRVISRSSTFTFKGKDVDIPTIARQLGVAYVLEGSVRKAGNQVRITAQLIEARSDTHLWSETYDRELENIFAVQDEISVAIVTALKERFELNVEAAPKVTAIANIKAHDAYLRGRYLVDQRTTTTIEAAVGEFKKVIAIDPDYALAHAELSMAILMLQNNVYGHLNHDEAIAKAEPHARRAIELDSKLAESHASVGFLQWSQENYEEALKHFEQAIRINPNYSIIYTWMANILDNQLGRNAEAFVARELALRLDPLSGPAINNYVLGLIVRNRLDEASREIEKIVSVYPDLHTYLRGQLSGIGGEWTNLILGGLNTLMLKPGSVSERADLSLLFAMIGLEKEAVVVPEVLYPEVMSILGKPAEAVVISEQRLAEFPDSNWIRNRLGKDLAAKGEYTRAWPILEEMWQRSGGRVSELGVFLTDNAAALIDVRRDIGEEAKVGDLLAAIRDNVRRKRDAGIIRAQTLYSVDFEEGLAYFLAGECKKGLELIARGVEDGFFIMPNEAYLQTLYDDPGFAPILAIQEARQARERDKFLAIVCAENPYEEVWQPTEETCEQFAVEGEN